MPAIPGGVIADDGAHVRGQGHGDTGHGSLPAEYLLELRAVALDAVDHRDDGVHILRAHVAAGPGGFGLFLQRIGAAVPVKLGVVADVPQGGGAACQLFLICSNGRREAVGKTVLHHVTGVARTAPVATETIVVVELPPQLRFGQGYGIVRGHGHGFETLYRRVTIFVRRIIRQGKRHPHGRFGGLLRGLLSR